ncbi:BRISC and BRCA1-A complex member 1 [Aplysia californica]|uniref:BRISC and BRCA1-A complex member 1 n=1 Tax=Aplysia californica TaxID=6500 RepID=A0ABM0JM49_APLCA|nr:BRISC and BRCA1-A complex member 1 [Aplysia californica]
MDVPDKTVSCSSLEHSDLDVEDLGLSPTPTLTTACAGTGRPSKRNPNADVLEDCDVILEKPVITSNDPTSGVDERKNRMDAGENIGGNDDNEFKTSKSKSNLVAKQQGTEIMENVVQENQATSRDGTKIQNPPTVVCPRVNCPEKIVICLDLSEEMGSTTFSSRAGDKFSSLELARRSIRMFVMHKSQMNPNHEFSLLVFHDDSTMIHNLTKRAKDVLNTLDEIDMATKLSEPLDLSHMFQTVKDNVDLPEVIGDPQVIPPPYVVRVLLVYGRSQSVPVGAGSDVQKELESSPYFFTDVLYIHQPPSEGNKCEEIFSSLCDLDHNGLSYIFEVSKYTPILNSGAKLLAHPLQRPQQLQAAYKIGTTPSAPQPMMEEKLH